MDGKKASLLCILKVLEEYTDENHFLTHKEIIAKVSERYGIEIERKSVASSLAILEEIGYDINKSPKGGFALWERTFDKSEVAFLVDAIFSSKAIPGSQAKILAEKAYSQLSLHQRKSFNYILKAEDVIRTDFGDVFYNIDLISDAIKQGKWIEFQYKTYDEDGKPAYNFNGYKYHVCPHFLINDFGHYYVIGLRSNYDTPSAYRIDFIDNIRIMEDRPVKKLKDGFSITDYINSHIYLFGGDEIEVKLELINGHAISAIRDWFGNEAKISKENDKLVAKIKTNDNGFFFWYMQYQANYTIIYPESLIEKVKTAAASILDRYN